MVSDTIFRSFLVVAFLLAGCTAFDPHNMIGRQFGEATGIPTEPVPGTAAKVLDAAARERAFDFVWTTINERYHDAALNGVDWNAVGRRYRPLALGARDDDAFWNLLDKMTGELRDAHTRVESGDSLETARKEYRSRNRRSQARDAIPSAWRCLRTARG